MPAVEKALKKVHTFIFSSVFSTIFYQKSSNANSGSESDSGHEESDLPAVSIKLILKMKDVLTIDLGWPLKA